MDIALLKKMNVYAPDQEIAGLITDDEEPTSTLIKADISLFHQMPERAAKQREPESAQPDMDVIPPEPEQPEIEPESVESPKAAEAPEVEAAPAKSDYDTGFEAGRVKADTVHKGTIKLLQKAVNAMQADLEAISKNIEDSHLATLASCLRAVFPALIKRETELVLVSLLRQACHVPGAGQTALRVHPDDVTDIESLCQQQSLSVSVFADPALDPGQIRAVWGEGGADIDCRKIAMEFMSRLEKSLPELTEAEKLENPDD